MIGRNNGAILALAIAAAALAGVAAIKPARRGDGSGDGGREGPDIIVYKSPTCGCCKKWIEHLQAAGFRVTARDTSDAGGVAAQAGVPRRLTACHTALVQGYVVEGHVPVDVIERLLKEHPDIAGVAVPGMPAGSPGMESETPSHYQILAFDKGGRTTVYGIR